MGGIWRNEKRARLVLGAGLPLLLLLLLPVLMLPMLLAVGARGTSGIQPAGPPSARNVNTDHHLRPAASARGQYSPPLREALSTNPLGKKSERGDDVPSTFATRFVLEGDFNGPDEASMTRPSLPAAVATSAAAAATASVGGSDPPRQSDPHHRQRGMQAVCSPGDDFSLVSTVHAEASGCYSQGANDTNAYFTADQDRIVLPASISASSSTSETFAWVAGKVLGFSGGALDVDPECVSDEPWTVNSHPMDAGSWSCLVGGTLVAFSQESFGIECGCSGDSSETVDVGSTPAPASANGSTPATSPSPSPSPAGELSCGADSFTITSPQLDDFEGCFADTGGGNGTLSSHYGQMSGELGGGSGTNAVFAAPIDERGHQVRWVAGTYANMSTDSGIVPTCISDDNATSVHPADSTWLCDLTGTGNFKPVNETLFRADCGCNSASSSSGTNSGETTPSRGGSGGSSSAAASTPTPSPNSQSATEIESEANGGSPTIAPGASSAFGLTAFVAALVGLARLFVGE